MCLHLYIFVGVHLKHFFDIRQVQTALLVKIKLYTLQKCILIIEIHYKTVKTWWRLFVTLHDFLVNVEHLFGLQYRIWWKNWSFWEKLMMWRTMLSLDEVISIGPPTSCDLTLATFFFVATWQIRFRSTTQRWFKTSMVDIMIKLLGNFG